MPVSPLRVSHVLYVLCHLFIPSMCHVGFSCCSCLALSIFLCHVGLSCVLLSSHVQLCVLVCISVGFLSYFDSPRLICLCLVLLPLLCV